MGAAHVERLAPRRRQHQPKAVDVGAAVDLAAEHAELLGQDVGELAGEVIADDRPRRGRADRDAEIDDLRLSHVARQDDVVGRDVAMDDALVRNGEAVGQPVAQPAHLFGGERPSRSASRATGRRRTPSPDRGGRSRRGRRLNRHDGVVAERSEDRSFAPEEIDDALIVGELRQDDLEGVSRIDLVGAIDLAHAAARHMRSSIS